MFSSLWGGRIFLSMNKTIHVEYENRKWSVDVDIYMNHVNEEIGRRFRPAIILCPGGAYAFRSDTENEYVAVKYQACGFQVFSLKYSVNEPFPTALMELAATVAYIRDNADVLDVDTEKVFVCGFSAGGHLAASLGVLWNSEIFNGVYEDKRVIKPTGMILCYPVITAGEYANRDTINNVSKGMDEKYTDYLSLEKNVSAETSKAFIWHTFSDESVPMENTLMFADAMRKAKVPFELHIFPEGCHGLSLATEYTAVSEDHINEVVSQWFDMSVKWIKSF